MTYKTVKFRSYTIFSSPKFASTICKQINSCSARHDSRIHQDSMIVVSGVHDEFVTPTISVATTGLQRVEVMVGEPSLPRASLGRLTETDC